MCRARRKQEAPKRENVWGDGEAGPEQDLGCCASARAGAFSDRSANYLVQTEEVRETAAVHHLVLIAGDWACWDPSELQ